MYIFFSFSLQTLHCERIKKNKFILKTKRDQLLNKICISQNENKLLKINIEIIKIWLVINKSNEKIL